MAPSLRRDILSAYAASVSRVLSWVVVTALVFRRSAEAFAMLALVRGTLGILNYCSLGLLPAMIRTFAAIAAPPPLVSAAPAPIPGPTTGHSEPLAYLTPQTRRDDALRQRQGLQPDAATQALFSAGLAIAAATTVFTIAVGFLCGEYVDRLFRLPPTVDASTAALLTVSLAFGFAFRWSSEPASALLQTRHQITLDNALVVATELAWAGLVWLMIHDRAEPLEATGLSFAVCGLCLSLARFISTHLAEHVTTRVTFDPARWFPLLSTGLLITLAQLADYLYAPTDYILINRLLTPADLAAYAPALQVDAGLMILVTALASVLLPRAALAHAAGDRRLVRWYYLWGTLSSAVVLALAGTCVYALSPWIFRLWLGNDMPATRRILPLVLAHTVIGGCSAVGRSILLAVGRTRPFAISVLLAGLTNVAASYAFVRYAHLGLAGIVLGTIVAVIARCGLWMPWYVLRELRQSVPPADRLTDDS
jgi:O-antigen/teichoic acid export membrane protein